MINTMEINPDELAGLDLFQNCRLCLAKEKVSVDIFSDGAEVRLLYYKIISCLPVQVTQEDDKLPKKICMTCNEKVDTFYQFWTLTAKTQKTLIDWAQQKDVITTKIKTENVPPGEMSFKQETIDYSDDNDNDDHYDDDNSDDDVEPSAIVKVCEETDEAGTSATAHIKLEEETPEKNQKPLDLKKSKIDELSESQNDSNSGDDLFCKRRGKVHSSTEDCNKYKTQNQIVVNVEKPFSCQLCPLSFKVKKNLDRHKISHSNEKPFPCNLCDLRFKTAHALKSHEKSVHQSSVDVEKPFSCSICQLSFRLKIYLKRHMISHSNEKPFPCSLCDLSFKRVHALKTHVKSVHQGIKAKVYTPYKCKICSKSFASQKNLDDHQYVHTGVKNHSCDICGVILATPNSLARHKRSIHEAKPDDVQKSFVCHICGNVFTTARSQMTHINLQHGDGKPSCYICGKKLSNNVVLKTHINMHLGIKPYSCDVCGHSFTCIKYLRLHMRNHTGETPFSCRMCSRGFKQRSALTGHIKSKHPDYKP